MVSGVTFKAGLKIDYSRDAAALNKKARTQLTKLVKDVKGDTVEISLWKSSFKEPKQKEKVVHNFSIKQGDYFAEQNNLPFKTNIFEVLKEEITKLTKTGVAKAAVALGAVAAIAKDDKSEKTEKSLNQNEKKNVDDKVVDIVSEDRVEWQKFMKEYLSHKKEITVPKDPKFIKKNLKKLSVEELKILGLRNKIKEYSEALHKITNGKVNFITDNFDSHLVIPPSVGCYETIAELVNFIPNDYDYKLTINIIEPETKPKSKFWEVSVVGHVGNKEINLVNKKTKAVDVYYNLEDYLVKAVGEYIIQDKDNLMKEYKEEN